MDAKRRVILTLVVLVISGAILYFTAKAVTQFTGYVISSKLGNENFAKCLGQNSILYVKAGCPHCANQEEMFGDYLVHLNIVDCAISPEKCQEAGIEYVPTWIINGEKQASGSVSLQELAKISGCKL
jgi:glutaredoxin